MNIMLNDEYRIDYDDMGYVLRHLEATEKTSKGDDGKMHKTGEISLEWSTEGYYGTVEQAVRGAYRHEVHASAIATLDELKTREDVFVCSITEKIRAVCDEVPE